jgi:hypothetical protein
MSISLQYTYVNLVHNTFVDIDLVHNTFANIDLVHNALHIFGA